MATDATPTAAEKAEAASKSTSSVTEGNAPQRSPGKVVRKLPPGSSRRAGKTADKRKGPFVKYVGDASLRVITASDWASLVDVEPKTKRTEDKEGNATGGFSESRWSVLDNERMVEASHFSESQLDYLLIDDMQPGGGHSFLEMDYDSEGVLVQVEYSDED